MSLRSGVGVGLSFKLPQDSLPGLLSGLPLGSSLRSMAGAPTKPQFWVTTWFISLSLNSEAAYFQVASGLFCIRTIFFYPTLWSKYTVLIVIVWLPQHPFRIHLSIHSLNTNWWARHFPFFSLCRGDVELNLTPSLILLGWREIQSQFMGTPSSSQRLHNMSRKQKKVSSTDLWENLLSKPKEPLKV